MDTLKNLALPTKNVVPLERFPGFKELLSNIRQLEPLSFYVDFPEEFDMSSEYTVVFPDGSSQSHPMASIVLIGNQPIVCYHPVQVLEFIQLKQLDYAKRSKSEKINEDLEKKRAKKKIDDIRQMLEELDDEE